MCGFIAQLVEHRTGLTEVTGLNPVEAQNFLRLHLSSCSDWKIYCDDLLHIHKNTILAGRRVQGSFGQSKHLGLADGQRLVNGHSHYIN